MYAHTEVGFSYYSMKCVSTGAFVNALLNYVASGQIPFQ